MSLEAIYFISQIVSALAIVASLIFVALQMRQADRTQRAMMHQLRAQRGMDMALRTMDDGIVQAMGRIIAADRSVERTDIMKVSGLLRAMIQNFVDTVWQHRAGFLDQSTYDYTIVPMRSMLSIPGMRAAWLLVSAGYSDAHVRMVNEHLIDGHPLHAPQDLAAVWRAFATQLNDQARPSPGQLHQPGNG